MDAGGAGVAVHRQSEREFLLTDSSDVGCYINHKVQAYVKNNTLHILYEKTWAVNEENLGRGTQDFCITVPAGETITDISLQCESVI